VLSSESYCPWNSSCAAQLLETEFLPTVLHINQGCGAGIRALELGILPGAGVGAQIKNQKEPELSLKFRIEAGVMTI